MANERPHRKLNQCTPGDCFLILYCFYDSLCERNTFDNVISPETMSFFFSFLKLSHLNGVHLFVSQSLGFEIEICRSLTCTFGFCGEWKTIATIRKRKTTYNFRLDGFRNGFIVHCQPLITLFPIASYISKLIAVLQLHWISLKCQWHKTHCGFQLGSKTLDWWWKMERIQEKNNKQFYYTFSLQLGLSFSMAS